MVTRIELIEESAGQWWWTLRMELRGRQWFWSGEGLVFPHAAAAFCWARKFQRTMKELLESLPSDHELAMRELRAERWSVFQEHLRHVKEVGGHDE